MLLSALWMALREIRRNVLRSFLTTLGIVIGVGAVIALVTLGQGATAKVTQDVSSLGNNMLTIMRGSARRGPVSATSAALELGDVSAILDQVPSVAAAAPLSSRSVLLVSGNKNHNATIQGSTNDWFDVRGWPVESGREFNELELAGGSAACVIGTTVKKELFGAQNPLDVSIRAGSVSCKIVGVLKSKGQSTFGDDQDDIVVMPIKTFQRRVSGSRDVDQIMISAADGRDMKSVTRALEGLMRERRRIAPGQEDDFSVRDMQEIAKALTSITSSLTALLSGIAAVSLLVGGIGIMNIMLVSVTERTREIGIRLSIGARRREVLAQFLVEAVTLSALGGVTGIVVGLGGSFAATRMFNLPFVFVPSIVVVAVLFSAAVGVAFGYFPARRAAGLNPIEALRHE